VVAFLVALLSACGPVENAGSRYVVSQHVAASQGALISVARSGAPALDGTVLDVPAGALKADTTLTLELGPEPITATAAQAAGPVAVWGPSGTVFSVPAELTLPYTLTGTQSASRLYVQVQEQDGTRSIVAHDKLTVDPATKTIRFAVAGFTSFQPGVAPAECQTNADCVTGEVCVAGQCHAPVCTVGQDWTCNDIPTMNSIAGQCDAPGSCTCRVGMHVNPATGKCTFDAAPDAGPACTNNTQCAGTDVCVNGACQPCAGGTCVQCRADGDCGAGQVCASGSCVAAPDAGVDGGTDGGSDGGVDGGTDGGVAACVNACPPTGIPPQWWCTYADGQTYMDDCIAACNNAGAVVSCPSAVDAGSAPTCRSNLDCAAGQNCVSGVCQ
jgi:Cys-rich repeat protein